LPRPKQLNPKIRLHIVFEPILYTKLKVLYAKPENETGLAFGKISEFVNQAVREKFERMATAKEPR
jgi:hypothetical protein